MHGLMMPPPDGMYHAAPPHQCVQVPVQPSNAPVLHESHHGSIAEEYIVVPRSTLPHARVRCAREAKCCKENGHRGRCSLSHKPRDGDMNRLEDQVNSLRTKLDEVKGERDHLRTEVGTLWTKITDGCAILTKLVRSRRTTLTSDAVASQEAREVLTDVHAEASKDEEAELREQFKRAVSTLQAVPLSGTGGFGSRELREKAVEDMTRQFETELASLRSASMQRAEASAADIVPIMAAQQQERDRASEQRHRPSLGDVLKRIREREGASGKRSRDNGEPKQPSRSSAELSAPAPAPEPEG